MIDNVFELKELLKKKVIRGFEKAFALPNVQETFEKNISVNELTAKDYRDFHHTLTRAFQTIEANNFMVSTVLMNEVRYKDALDFHEIKFEIEEVIGVENEKATVKIVAKLWEAKLAVSANIPNNEIWLLADNRFVYLNERTAEINPKTIARIIIKQ